MSNTPWVAVIIFLIYYAILICHFIINWLVVTKRVGNDVAAALLGLTYYFALKRRNFELSRREIVLGIALYALMLLAPPILYFIS